jgi:hypothetical protein
MTRNYEIVRPGQEHPAAIPGHVTVLDEDGKGVLTLMESEGFTDEQILRCMAIYRGAYSIGYMEGRREQFRQTRGMVRFLLDE